MHFEDISSHTFGVFNRPMSVRYFTNTNFVVTSQYQVCSVQLKMHQNPFSTPLEELTTLPQTT